MSKVIFYFILLGITVTSCRTKKNEVNQPQQHSSITLTTQYIEAFRQAFLQQNETAKDIFNSILETHPWHHPSHYELGKLFFNEGKYDKAIEHLNKAVKLDPNNIWYKILLAQSYIMMGEYKDAIEVYEKLTRQYPNSSDFLIKLGDLYFQANNATKALETFNYLEKKIGPTEEVYRRKFEIYLTIGQEEKAYQELATMLKTIPGNPQYSLKLAEYYFKTGRIHLGYDYLQKTLSYDPSNTLANLYLADYYFLIKDTLKAKEQVNSLIERSDISVDDKVFIVLSLMQKDLYGDSLIIFSFINNLIKQYPDDPKIYALSGDVHFQRNHLSEAIEFWKRSIHLDSSRYLVWENLLYAQFLTDDRQGLFTFVPRAMELFPEQPHLQFFHYYLEFIKQNFEAINSQLKNYVKYFKDKELERFTKILLSLSNLYSVPNTPEEAIVAELEKSGIETFSYMYFCFLIQVKTDTLKALSWASKHPFKNLTHLTYQNAIKAFYEKNYKQASFLIHKTEYQKEFFPEILELAGDIALKEGSSEEAIDWWTYAYALTKSPRINIKLQTQLNYEKK
ncbi:MAG: tetratricopeptide repeat protein [Bacteroidales bacterium]|nr:tetratricopeptide repeat protein [Bacteroidales bacterium]